jgi:hypothetical protein
MTFVKIMMNFVVLQRRDLCDQLKAFPKRPVLRGISFMLLCSGSKLTFHRVLLENNAA